MSNANTIEEEQHFLHDLSNPLSIAYGGVKLLSMKLEQNPSALPVTEIVERVNKIVFHFERVTDLLNARRDRLRSLTVKVEGS